MLTFKGLDKVEVNGLYVKNIDYDKLLNNSNVQLYTSDVTIIKNERAVSNFKIIDDELFSSFIYGVKKIDVRLLEYTSLTLKVVETGQNNLIPYNIGYYLRRLKRVKEKLKERYGIELIGDNKLKMLEYNKTIFLNDNRKMQDYEKCLELLKTIAPKHLKSSFTWGKNKEIETVYIKNRNREWKFYDKAKQLKETQSIDVEKQVMRIEYSLLNTEQIRKEFNVETMEELKDNKLESTFIKSFEKDFIKPFEKWIEKSNKELVKLAKEFKAEKVRSSWLEKVIITAQRTGLLFCKEQLYEVTKKVDKINYNRLNKRIDKLFLDDNNYEKMLEIFEAVYQ